MSGAYAPRPGMRARDEPAPALAARHPEVRVVAAARDRRGAIAALLEAVDAPSWAAHNLDALADVLGDLSWLDSGPVVLAWPGARELGGEIAAQLLEIVGDAARESAGSLRPLTVYLTR